MKEHFYYNIMRKTIVMFLDMFNNIKIARYDKDTGEVLKYLKVPLKFAPKTKNWYWVEKMQSDGTRIRDRILPMMAINMISTEFDNARLTNKHQNIRTNRKTASGGVYRYKNLIPYNYTFELNIAAEYMVDITQIVEQILPFFTPTAFVRITIPELDIDTGGEFGTDTLDLKVVLESSTKEESLDMAEDEYRSLAWQMSFKVEGYLSQSIQEDKIVKSVIQDFHVGSVTPSAASFTTITTGLSAEDYPMDVTTEELSGALYDDEIKLLYTYERIGD
jgi:hypothetical protein